VGDTKFFGSGDRNVKTTPSSDEKSKIIGRSISCLVLHCTTFIVLLKLFLEESEGFMRPPAGT